MENRLETERSRSLGHENLRAIEHRVDTLGATQVPIHLGWMKRDLRRLVLELGRWRTALDRLIGIQEMKLRLAEQAMASAPSAESHDVNLELKMLLTQERYAALQALRLELVGAILPSTDATPR